MKTGLNDIDINIEVTTSLKCFGFSICFLKILEHFHFYYEVICFRIILVVTFFYMTLITSCKYILMSTSLRLKLG